MMKRVVLKEDYDPMFKGSTIQITSETKNFYKGIWTSMYGTYFVKVPKKICKRYIRPEWMRVFNKLKNNGKKSS